MDKDNKRKYQNSADDKPGEPACMGGIPAACAVDNVIESWSNGLW